MRKRGTDRRSVSAGYTRVLFTLAKDRMVFVGGGSRGTFPSLDLTFPPTGLSENLGVERGGEGKGREGWGRPPALLPPPLASASNTTLAKDIVKLFLG